MYGTQLKALLNDTHKGTAFVKWSKVSTSNSKRTGIKMN